MGGPIAQDALLTHTLPLRIENARGTAIQGHTHYFLKVSGLTCTCGYSVHGIMFRFSRFVYNFRDNLVRVWKVENRSPVYQSFAEKVIHSAQTWCV